VGILIETGAVVTMVTTTPNEIYLRPAGNYGEVFSGREYRKTTCLY